MAPNPRSISPTESPAATRALRPTESAVRPTESAVRPTESAVRPTESAVRPTESAVRPTESAVRPTESAARPTESAVRPTESAVRPTESAAQVTPTRPRPPRAARLRVTPRRAIGLATLAVAIAALAIFGLRAHSAPPQPAPALPTIPLVGHPVSLRQLAGEPAFVVFWASWCGPCAREARAIETFARDEAGRAHVVGVDWDDAAGSARNFARQHDWTFSSMGDPNGLAGERYGLTGLPTTFLIDGRGRIVKRLVGEQTLTSLRTALSNV